jgi:hypothetical protein
MSIQQGNPGIVTKDLQLYYNREYNGSFLGEATVNFFTIPTTVDAWGTHTSVRTSTSSGVPDLIVSGNKQVYYTPEYYTLTATSAWQAEVNRWLVYPKQGSGTNSYVPNGTYNFSFYARSLSGNTVLQYSFYGITPRSTATLTTKWQRFNGTFTISNGPLTLLEFGNLNAGSMVCQIACIQVEAKSYATPFTVPVLWTPNLVSVTSTSGHTTMTKNTSDSWTNSRVYSSEGYNEPCYVSFKANATDKGFMIALNNDPATGINYTNLDYAWHPTTAAVAYIYESGTDRGLQGSYTTSTLFEIIYDGININYYMDGVLKRSVARTGSGPLYLDSSFYTLNSQVVNLSFGPLSQINRFSNYVIGGGGLLDLSGNGHKVDLTSSGISYNSSGFYFNGDYAGVITVPVTNSVLDTLSNVTHTYEVWFQLLGTPPGSSDGYFFGRQGFHEGFAHFKSTPTTFGVLSWYNDNNNTGWLSYPGALNTWYHAAYVVNVETGFRYLYVNGALYSGGNLTSQLKQYVSGPSYYYHFGSANPSYSSNIALSSAKAYNRALTSAEILRNFNAGRKAYGI